MFGMWKISCGSRKTSADSLEKLALFGFGNNYINILKKYISNHFNVNVESYDENQFRYDPIE
jgi:hypothetical protein